MNFNLEERIQNMVDDVVEIVNIKHQLIKINNDNEQLTNMIGALNESIIMLDSASDLNHHELNALGDYLDSKLKGIATTDAFIASLESNDDSVQLVASNEAISQLKLLYNAAIDFIRRIYRFILDATKKLFKRDEKMEKDLKTVGEKAKDASGLAKIKIPATVANGISLNGKVPSSKEIIENLEYIKRIHYNSDSKTVAMYKGLDKHFKTIVDDIKSAAKTGNIKKYNEAVTKVTNQTTTGLLSFIKSSLEGVPYAESLFGNEFDTHCTRRELLGNRVLCFAVLLDNADIKKKFKYTFFESNARKIGVFNKSQEAITDYVEVEADSGDISRITELLLEIIGHQNVAINLFKENTKNLDKSLKSLKALIDSSDYQDSMKYVIPPQMVLDGFRSYTNVAATSVTNKINIDSLTEDLHSYCKIIIEKEQK